VTFSLVVLRKPVEERNVSDLNTSRRTIVKGAAWAVPAISVAAAAPSLAASPDPTLPNLSTSVQGEGSGRTSATVLEIKPASIINTGGSDALGLVVTFETDGVKITDLKLGTLSPGLLGITVADLNSTFVTMTVPAGLATVKNGTPYLSPFSQVLTFENGNALNLTVIATAGNGGVPFTPPVTPVPVYVAP
jgi:hypothetical protein